MATLPAPARRRLNVWPLTTNRAAGEAPIASSKDANTMGRWYQTGEGTCHTPRDRPWAAVTRPACSGVASDARIAIAMERATGRES